MQKSGWNHNCFSAVIKRNPGFFERIIRHYLVKANIPASICFDDWKYDIKNYNKIICFDYGYNAIVGSYIKKQNPNCKVFLFAFNKLDDEHANLLKADKNIDDIWTFDSADAHKYGFKESTPFYSRDLFALNDVNADECVVFVGGAKKREKMIHSIKESLDNYGIKSEFHIIRDKSEYISYNDYLNMIRRNSCILDITNQGQVGLTLRVMEALFLSKKLITNNVDVRKYSFYRPENIYIIEDGMEDISSFLKTPYVQVSPQYIEYYDIVSWIQRFNN